MTLLGFLALVLAGLGMYVLGWWAGTLAPGSEARRFYREGFADGLCYVAEAVQDVAGSLDAPGYPEAVRRLDDLTGCVRRSAAGIRDSVR